MSKIDLAEHEVTQELVRAAAAGDAGAINLERHRDALKRLIRFRMIGKWPAVDASDIVRTLLEASRRLRDYVADPTMPFHSAATSGQRPNDRSASPTSRPTTKRGPRTAVGAEWRPVVD
jgi:hypothetical protein